MASPLDIGILEAREIVLRVSRENGWHEPELDVTADPRILASITHLRRLAGDAVETIAEDIGSVRGRFILELTQNVEDSSFSHTDSPWLSFEVHPESIIVESNQDGFNANDVRQICRTGRSWKRQQHGYVGEKGIGFKAVFQVASRVYIQSNAFSFYFIYRRDGTVEERMGMVTPLLADDHDPIPMDERPLTRMTLIPNDIRYENLIDHFDEVHPTLLLFLSKIQRISIKVHKQPRATTVTTFTKRVPLEDTSTNPTLLIKTIENEASNTNQEISRYYIFRYQITGLSEDIARPERDGCELVLAFEVDECDQPIKPTLYDVFAYLPVGNFGFNFLIQADFILQANREEVKADSDWNKDILSEIADNFCNALLDFCSRDGPLRYRWVEYLPFGRALEIRHFWRGLPSKIISQLKSTNILYLHGTSELRKPENMRILPPHDYLDDDGLPLFRDRPGSNSKYLSLEYSAENTKILKELFEIRDIEDLAICHRIKHDLRCPDSKMKSRETSDSWHSKAAHLIITILERSRGTELETMILEDLPLIPLNDGRWVTASETEFYFPAETGPAIPQDLVITIDPESIENEARERLFEALGAKECPPEEVISKMWEAYSRRGGAANIASSKSHLSYLYWHFEDISALGFSHLWIYDDNERKINTRRTNVPVYLPSEDEYGPQALFRGESPQLQVSFLNSKYSRLVSPINRQTLRHERSWPDWLKQALIIRNIPRLRFDAGSLSTEFRYILQHRPNKIIGTLKKHWPTYRQQMTFSIIEEIKKANVSCWGVPPTKLESTYFPAENLMNECAHLGIIQQFPFLERGTVPDYEDSPEDWAFLRRFGVQSEANINFYLEILRQHETQLQRAWGLARADILRTYSSIVQHYSERVRETIIEAFHRDNLILDPSCFAPDSTGPRWIDIDSCIWEGPSDLLDRTPLQTLSEYRTDERIARLFHVILEIKDADWSDYIRTLSKLKTDQIPQQDIANKAWRLYNLLSDGRISIRDWDSIRNTFEAGELIYVPSTNQWYPPSRCLWSSPVPVEGMAVIGTDYSEGPQEFFLQRLRISPATLATLVQELRALGERRASVESIKNMIKAISRECPTQQDLEPLTTSNMLPIRRHASRDSVTLGNLQETFAIVDNTIFSAIFQDHVDFLDFSLEEVLELAPFLRSLGLKNKYLSLLCKTETACEDGMIDEWLTAEFIDRAYDILRIAVSYRTPTTYQALYDQLRASSVLKTDNISTTYTLHHANGERTGPISKNSGYVHIRDQENGWQIFVPRQRSNREVCYKMHLPEALAKRLEIPMSCREHIGFVLTSGTSVIDDLLETVGIGYVPGIEAIPRRAVEDSDEGDEEEEVVTPEGTSRTSVGEFFSMPQMSQASTTASQGHFTPPSNISSPRTFFEPEPELELENIPSILPRGLFGYIDAYTQFLGHVIQIARQTSLPPSNFAAGPSRGHDLPGYNHQAIFGVRALDQMRHDSKIGAAGELFVYEILRNALSPQFGPENWKSTIRHLVTIHPQYRGMGAWDGRHETSDIVYPDTGSHLTGLLVRLGYLDRMWTGCEPEYFIEVKATTGSCADRFFMSSNQYDMMQDKSLWPGVPSSQIYIICRVFDLGKDSMNLKIYVDPEAHRLRNCLLFTSSWTVRPGA